MNFSLKDNSKTPSLKIKDLAILEELSIENASGIIAGAQIGIEATASATGDDSSTIINGDTNLRTIANGRGSIGRGKGSALAIGDDPMADTSYTAEGFDKVIAKERNKKGKNSASSNVMVIGIDRPSR